MSQELTDGGFSGFPTHPDAQAALRRLVQALPRLRIGTLDSFFLQILRQFRLEVGIGTDPAITQEQENPEENRVLQRLLEQKSMPADQQRELMEAFKLATFGEEKKSVYGSIQRLIQNQFELFQRAPDSDRWGNPVRIWEGDASWLTPPPESDWSAIFAALEAQAAILKTPSLQKAWLQFTLMLEQVRGGSDYDFGSTLAERIYQAFSVAEPDCDTIPFGRGKISLLPETQVALMSLIASVRHQILLRQIARTKGLFRLLDAYGQKHLDHILQTGQLSFNDIAQLLAPASGPAPDAIRNQMDCRLDARFLHWLLDEFQDTSLIQWAVIENLLDEVIQNPDGDRTLFYVGDTKQAIYEWRSGDPRLFRRILEKYNRPGHTAIEVADPLVKSWRSSPVILEAINTVFGQLPKMMVPKDEKLQTDWEIISRRWANDWTPHEAAEKNLDLTGTATLHVLPKLKKDEEGPTPMEAAAEWIQKLQKEIPHFDRTSVAILTRSNPDGVAMLDLLADRGVHAIWAGDSSLLDNALLPAIVSLATLVEHPGDTLARQHIEMSALCPQLSLEPSALAAWGRLIREQGYAGFIARLATDLTLPPEAALERSRLRTLISLAAEFDRQPDGTALQFASFIQSQSLSLKQTGSNIQILTMHKAKGLEYDIVLLPALGNSGITSKGKGPLLVREQEVNEPNPPVDWILSSSETPVIEADTVLDQQLAKNRQGKALEELRLLYVAMTRAKRALHIFTVEPAKSSKTLRLDTVVQNTLASNLQANGKSPVWQSDNPEWWKQEQTKTDPIAPPSAPLDFEDLPQTEIIPPLESHIASQEHATGEGTDGRHFRPEGAEARDLGTRVHELFEQIEWLAPGKIPGFDDATPQDAQLVTDFLATPENHRFFEKPEGETVELLREQAFEAILDGKWLSGKIDRLHLVRDAAGKPVRATVIDFKTDRTPNPKRHRPQMNDYRNAVSRLFGLPPDQVTCTLLFVRSGTMLDV